MVVLFLSRDTVGWLGESTWMGTLLLIGALLLMGHSCVQIFSVVNTRPKSYVTAAF